MRACTVRGEIEERERHWLRPAATLSAGADRPRPEEESALRAAFQRDRDRVIHAKAFRRLKHKTQVFISPDGDHYRTRMTHTLEVTQIARTIGRALRLNEDLIEAIGLAHDLGHTPFGHAGERAIAEVYPGFRHNEQSLRVVDRIEKDGRGLNLTNVVRDGILRHSKPSGSIMGAVSGQPRMPEAQVVKISDGVAYINHDLDDALRAGVVRPDEVPGSALQVLGRGHAERINTLVSDIVARSDAALDAAAPGEPVILMSDDVRRAADELRDFLFERVYAPINQAEETLKVQAVVKWLVEHYSRKPEEVPEEFARALADDSPERVAVDFVASMTDRYALARFEDLNLPRYWSI